VACNSSKSNDTDVTSCRVSHSGNTVPHFNCSRELSNKMAVSTTEIRQNKDSCLAENAAYNSTTATFIVNNQDINKPAIDCVLQYRSPTDSSTVYLTEHFVLHREVHVTGMQESTLSISSGMYLPTTVSFSLVV